MCGERSLLTRTFRQTQICHCLNSATRVYNDVYLWWRKRARRQIFRSCHENADGYNNRLDAWVEEVMRALEGDLERKRGRELGKERGRAYLNSAESKTSARILMAPMKEGRREEERVKADAQAGAVARSDQAVAKSIQSANSPPGYASVVSQAKWLQTFSIPEHAH